VLQGKESEKTIHRMDINLQIMLSAGGLVHRLYKNYLRHQWPTPVILATQEAEIRRISV
jgi:hypothetical protein